MAADILAQPIRQYLAPLLRADGFQGSGRTFTRVSADMIHVVQVQGSRWGGRFAVNLGLQPIWLETVLGDQPEPKKMKPELCEFTRRLSTPPMDDQWWSYDPTSSSVVEAVQAATTTYRQFGRSAFDAICSPDSALRLATPRDIRQGRIRFYGFGATDVRMARALALMRQAEGDLENARGFAIVGLERVGSNSPWLRHELEALATAGLTPPEHPSL